MGVTVGTTGNDTLRGTKRNDNLSGGDGDDILYAGKGFDLLNGGNGNDRLKGDLGNDTLNGDAGDDQLYGAAGEDSILGGDGNDTIISGSGNDYVEGGVGDDVILGNAGSDTLIGGDGNDTLDGGRNSDILAGGNGDDLYSFSLTGDKFGFGDDKVVDTVGNDTLTFSTLSNTVTVNLATSMVSHVHDTVDFTGASSIASIIGGSGNDTFIAGQGFNAINLNGGTGNNTMDGSLVTSDLNLAVNGGTFADGAHTITFSNMNHFITGSGDDTITVTDISSPVTIDGGTGVDAVDMSSLGAGADAVVSFGVPNLTGATQVSQVETVTTGAGNDSFVFGNAFSSVTLNGGTGTNTLDLSHLTTSGATVDFAAGTATNTGSAGVVTFTNIANATGGAANDTFKFGDGFGNHTVSGGAGVNTLDLSAVTSNVTLNAVGGTVSSGGDTLTITNVQSLKGGTGDDTYGGFASGGFGSLTLNDAAGTDVLDLTGFTQSQVTSWQAVDSFGSDGLKDSLVVHLSTGDTVTVQNYFDNSTSDVSALAAGAGALESFHFSDGNLAFGDITYVGGAPVPTPTPTPTPTPSPSPTLTGGTGNDTLTGTSSDESLTGDLGDDTLNGGGGNDTLNGGDGNDTYNFTGVSFGNATVTDSSGNDVLDLSAISADLTVNLGTSAVTSTAGNVDYNGSTIETIIGGSGNDTFTAPDGFSVITLDGGTGNNTLNVSASTAALTLDVDAGTITDATNTISFSNFNDFKGGSANDTLDGGSANDTLDGGAGDDSLSGGTGNNTYAFSGASFGNDTITDAAGTNTLNFSAVSADLTVTLATGMATSTAGNVDYSAGTISSITGGSGNNSFVVADGYGAITVDGGTGGNNTLDASATTTALTMDVNAGTVNDGAHTITYTDFSTVKSGSGADTFTMSTVINGDTLDAGGGNNTLNMSAATGALTMDLSAGTVSDGTNTTTVTGFNYLKAGAGADALSAGTTGISMDGGAGNDSLTGGAGNDTFLFSGANFGDDTVVDSSGGTNTLNFSGISADMTVNLGTGSVTTLASGSSIGSVDYSGATIQHIVGGTGYNDFIAQNNFGDIILDGGASPQHNTLDVTASTAASLSVDLDAGTVTDGTHTITFTDFNYLKSGIGDDSFVLSAVDGYYTLDGGSGNDTLDMSGATGDAVVSLGATGFVNETSVAGFETITTGSGDDIFAMVDGFATASLDGSTGTNSLDLSSVVIDDVTATFTTGTGGTLSDSNSASVVTFTNMQDITTGAGNDTIKFGDAYGIHSVDGGTGSNTLDLSAMTTDAVFDFSANTITSGGNTLNLGAGTFQTFLGGTGDNDVYQGFGTGGFGQISITDAGGTNDTMDLTGFNISQVDSWEALASQGDGLKDELKITLHTGDVIIINNYFDHTTSSNASLAAGTGAMAFIDFNGGGANNLAFADVKALL